MKLKKYSSHRRGDKVEVHASWVNKFRKPAYVPRIIPTSEDDFNMDTLLVEGDVKEVHGILFGIATIAWDMGWRPPGLLETLMKHLQDYKISGPK